MLIFRPQKTKATAVVDLSVFLPLKTSVASLLKSAIECIADRRMEFEKNVAFMEKASGVVRALRGGKAVFCKSGKDRCVGLCVAFLCVSAIVRSLLGRVWR